MYVNYLIRQLTHFINILLYNYETSMENDNIQEDDNLHMRVPPMDRGKVYDT